MKKIYSVFLSFFLIHLAFANVSLPKFFSDNMVLQRNQLIPIWGWANAGEKITVQFDKQSKTTKAGKDGKWMMKLDAGNCRRSLSINNYRKKYFDHQQCFGWRSVDMFRSIEYGNAN